MDAQYSFLDSEKVEEETEKKGSVWSNHVLSAGKDERAIIQGIINLHNGGEPFDVDPCYSTGRFWEGLPEPKMKFDINPRVEGCEKASADNLPLKDGSVSSVMFDPPFVVRVRPSESGKIASRFSFFKSVSELWSFYMRALGEFYRILKPDGIVAFKCQDMVDSGTQRMSHYEIMKYAEFLGYYFQDLFVLVRDNVMFSPNMKNQKNARKNHCYFIVLRKSSNAASLRASQLPVHDKI